jgi:hypothetical protein
VSFGKAPLWWPSSAQSAEIAEKAAKYRIAASLRNVPDAARLVAHPRKVSYIDLS